MSTPIDMVLHCPACGRIWRPADVFTNGVAAVKTKGKDDSPIAQSRAQVVPAEPTREQSYRIALITIATLPISEQDDMPSANMRKIAANALTAPAVSEPAETVYVPHNLEGFAADIKGWRALASSAVPAFDLEAIRWAYECLFLARTQKNSIEGDAFRQRIHAMCGGAR